MSDAFTGISGNKLSAIFINLPLFGEEGFKCPEITHYQLSLQVTQLSIPLQQYLKYAPSYPAENKTPT